MTNIVFSIIVLMFAIYTTGLSLMMYTENKFSVKVIPFFAGVLTIAYVLYNLGVITINL